MKLLTLTLFFIVSLSANNIKVLESKYLLDAEHVYSINQVYENKDELSNFLYEKKTFGLKDDTLWIYIKVKSTAQVDSANMIEFLYPLHDYIEVNEYNRGKIIDKYITGDLTKYGTRKVDATNFIVPYTLKADETKEFIFKIDSKSSLSMGMKFLSKDEYYIKNKNKELILGSYYGAVLIMLLYNIILYLMIKEKVYLYYVLFHISYVLAQLSLNGFAFAHLWPDYPEINSYFFPLLMIITNYYSIVFSLEFLDLKKYHLKFYNYYRFLIALHFILFFTSFFLSYSSTLKTMLVISIISISSLLFTGIYILIKHKTVSSKFFVIAWSSILIGAMLTEFQNSGILDMSTVVSYGAQIGAFIELTLLSIALAYRYNTVYNKLALTESNLRTLNTHLQEKVDEQTKDLKLMIKELHHRVKNNFQVILTFLWAQKKSIKDESSIKALEQTTQRIYAISSLHELLNISDAISINIKTYIQGILDSFIIQDDTIVYKHHVEEIMLNYDEAVVIGLILNELITNSNKYAFQGITNPYISVNFSIKENKYMLKYTDNGIGCDESKIENSSGLGYDLINGLSQKNNAELSISSNNGMELTMIFDKKMTNE